MSFGEQRLFPLPTLRSQYQPIQIGIVCQICTSTWCSLWKALSFVAISCLSPEWGGQVRNSSWEGSCSHSDLEPREERSLRRGWHGKGRRLPCPGYACSSLLMRPGDAQAVHSLFWTAGLAERGLGTIPAPGSLYIGGWVGGGVGRRANLFRVFKIQYFSPIFN